MVSILRDSLATAWEMAIKFVDSRGINDVKKQVLLEGDGKTIRVWSAGNRGYFCYDIEQDHKPFVVALPHEKMSQIIAKSTADKIDITVKDSKAMIVSGTSKFNIATVAPELAVSSIKHPAFLKESLFDSYFEIEAKPFAQALRRTLPVTRTDKGSKWDGVRLELDRNESHAVSTNGKSISIYKFDSFSISNCDPIVDCIEPASAEIAYAAASKISSKIKIKKIENDMLFQIGNATMSFATIAIQYPKWKRIVPNASLNNSFKSSVAELKSALDQVMIVMDAENRGIDIAIKGEELSLAATGQGGTCDAKIPIIEVNGCDEGHAISSVDTRCFLSCIGDETEFAYEYIPNKSGIFITSEMKFVFAPLIKE